MQDNNNIKIINPEDIERRSFEIITEIMGQAEFPKGHEPIIKRVIHTTADFEFAKLINISEKAVESAVLAVKSGCNIVTDTKMAFVGINKKCLAQFGGEVVCFMDDESVATEAKIKNVTRASLCMEKAALNEKNLIYAVGNAPTALISLYELVRSGRINPALIIGVPVGFVNVLESKELIKSLGIPYIITEGRKGGSPVAAAIVNAILYMIGR